jgi:hypothetical protein
MSSSCLPGSIVKRAIAKIIEPASQPFEPAASWINRP